MRFSWNTDMSVMVTGATGHLGPHLVAELLRTAAFDRLYVVARSSHEPAESRVRSIEHLAPTSCPVTGTCMLT